MTRLNRTLLMAFAALGLAAAGEAAQQTAALDASMELELQRGK